MVEFGEWCNLVECCSLVSGGLTISPVTDCTSSAGPGMLYPADNASNKGDFHPRKKEESIRESVHKAILPTLTPIKRETLSSPEKKDIIKHKDVWGRG